MSDSEHPKNFDSNYDGHPNKSVNSSDNEKCKYPHIKSDIESSEDNHNHDSSELLKDELGKKISNYLICASELLIKLDYQVEVVEINRIKVEEFVADILKASIDIVEDVARLLENKAKRSSDATFSEIVRVDTSLLLSIAECIQVEESNDAKEVPSKLDHVPNETIIPERRSEAGTRKLLSFTKLAPLHENEEVVVRLTSFVSPNEMSFSRAGSFFKASLMMHQDLEEACNKGLKTLENNLDGSPCIISDEDEKCIFRRGRIESTSPESGMTKVFLVDLGVDRNVKNENVYDIDAKFLDFPEMGLRFSMSDISPIRGDFWSDRAKALLKHKISNKELVLTVSRQTKGDKLEGLLFEVLTEDFSINHWLVLEGEAKFDFNKRDINSKCKTSLEKSRRKANATDDKSYSCKVVEVQTPTSIFVRKLSDEDSFYHLDREIQEHYTCRFKYKPEVVKVTPDSMAVVFNKESNRWERCKVVKIFANKVDLFLIDSGTHLKTHLKELEPLDRKFCMRNFTEEVYLSQIYPATNSGKWGKNAIEYLKKLLEEVNKIVDLEQDGKSGQGRIPAKVFVSVIRGNKAVRLDVQQELVKLGFASTFVKPRTKCQSLPFDGPSSISNGDHVHMQLFKDEEELFIWPQHPRLEEDSSFVAVASYVDWNGNVYLRLKSSDASLERINSEIHLAFHDTKPSPEDLYWSVGEAATVKWHLDNKWYRAFVLQVRPNVCRVKLIDFGTEELCLFENMRKRLMFKDVPIQCFPLKLFNCSPAGGEWDEESLTFLHELVVDKELMVQINKVENLNEVIQLIISITILLKEHCKSFA